jgi:hypothetical protein
MIEATAVGDPAPTVVLGRTLNVVKGGTCPWCQVTPSAMAVHVHAARWVCCGHTMTLPPLPNQKPNSHRTRLHLASRRAA